MEKNYVLVSPSKYGLNGNKFQFRKIKLNTKKNGLQATQKKYEKALARLNKKVEKISKKITELNDVIIVSASDLTRGKVKKSGRTRRISVSKEKLSSIIKRVSGYFINLAGRINDRVTEKLKSYGYDSNFAKAVDDVVAKRNFDMATNADLMTDTNKIVEEERKNIVNDAVSNLQENVAIKEEAPEKEETPRMKPSYGVRTVSESASLASPSTNEFMKEKFGLDFSKLNYEKVDKGFKPATFETEEVNTVKKDSNFKPATFETEKVNTVKKDSNFKPATFETEGKKDVLNENTSSKLNVSPSLQNVSFEEKVAKLKRLYEEELKEAAKQSEINNAVSAAIDKKHKQKDKINNAISAMNEETAKLQDQYVSMYEKALSEARQKTASIKSRGEELRREDSALAGEINSLNSKMNVANSRNMDIRDSISALNEMLSTNEEVHTESNTNSIKM